VDEILFCARKETAVCDLRLRDLDGVRLPEYHLRSSGSLWFRAGLLCALLLYRNAGSYTRGPAAARSRRGAACPNGGSLLFYPIASCHSHVWRL